MSGLSTTDWVILIYLTAWLCLQGIEAIGADPRWIEAVGLVALAVLARPDTNRGRAALIVTAILAVVAVPELVWSAWTGDPVMAVIDIAYLALAWMLRSDFAAAVRGWRNPAPGGEETAA